MIPTYEIKLSVIPFIDWYAKHMARQSIYKDCEIAWLLEVLYSLKFKKKDECKEVAKKIIIHSANANVKSLFQHYKEFCDNGFIRPVNVRRETYRPKNFATPEFIKTLK